MTYQHCQRCGAESQVTTMSYFSEETICMDCDQLERSHPLFDRAMDTEITQVRCGNYNYNGIGTPSDLLEASIDARMQRDHLNSNTH